MALDGAGWHPAAWREPDARPDALFSAGYWTDLALEADAAGLELVTLEDTLGIQSSHWDEPDERTDQVRGRLDAVLVAARVAPLTTGLGLVPTATTTHPEPFHVSKAIATLDFVSGGRAGWRAQVSPRAAEAADFGRRTVPPFRPGGPEPEGATASGLLGEAADFVEVVRRLWDSWEDDAEIRDQRSGRFVDREKLHYIDFEGRRFSVRGPSITPRPPQGQPVVAVLAHGRPVYELATRAADVVFVTPHDRASAAAVVAEIRQLEAEAGRAEPLRILADLLVFLDDTEAAAVARRSRLDDRHGRPAPSDAHPFVGTSAGLADRLEEWHAAGVDGFRLRPAALPHDLLAVARQLVPELRRRGRRGEHRSAATLRGQLGLDRPANRYAAAREAEGVPA